MKALPKKVRIGAFDYKVQYEEQLSEIGLCGRIQLLHGIIDMRPGMSADVERMVLLHEVMHGYLFHAGIQEHDERHLDVLAHGVAQIIRDNPELLK